ncbi:MAG TPA: MOSC domain-containing protein [Nitrospiraceae bacterium]|jgi:MOSC domain-containing protein YiiM|nr:MOSC domain-containing protein [Nitrospiraceae bacterium]
MMVIRSLNVGLPAKELFFGKEIITGICKKPIMGPVHLWKGGFDGDGVADLKHHGGLDKAICVYGSNHYPHWKEILKRVLPPAPFGENLSLSNLDEATVCIGDIFQAGTAIVQISQPRQPCATLAARYGRGDMVKLVVDSGRTGCYFRVIEEGIVEIGNALILKERDHHGISVSFANRIFHHDRKNREGIEKVLAIDALSASWREAFIKLRAVA